LAKRHPAPSPAAKKRVTVKELLQWAYGRQMVDVAVGRTLDDVGGGGWSAPSFLSRLGEPMGSGAGAIAALSWDHQAVHPDALRAHFAVTKLPQLEAEMAMEFGRTGIFPEAAQAIPRPGPRQPSNAIGDRRGQAVIDGVECQYRIDCLGVEIEPVKRGKKRTIIGYRRVEILVCPLEWWPDPAWYEMVQSIDRRWREIEAKLVQTLDMAGLSAHEIVAAVNPPSTTPPVA
jgi:hypothetical protein